MDYYNSRFYNYRPAQAYMRFTESEALEIKSESGKEVPKMDLRLVESTQDNTWPLENWGVLGLSPKGSVFSYLNELYDESENISMALKYESKKKKVSSDELTWDLNVYMNPIPEKHYKSSEVVGTFILDPESESWYIDGSVKLPDTEFEYTNQKLCLDSFSNDWIGVIEGTLWCQRVRQAVCNTTEAKKCKEKDANMSLAPKIELIVGGQDLSIHPDDYIYFDDEGLQCRIGDPCTARDLDACPPDTEVVLGKKFMEKYIPILSANKTTNDRTVKLVKYFITPKSRKVIWIVLGILVVIIAVVGVIYVITKRKQASDEAHYVKV